MLKLFLLLAVLIIGFIAYTGIDATNEYESISKIRDFVLNEIVDPVTKKILVQTSHLNEIIEKSILGH